MAAGDASAQAMDRAAAAFAAGRLDEAAMLCASILRADPAHFHALHLGCVLALRRGAPDEAAALATRALRVRAGQPDVLSNRGTALRQLGRPEEALADYDAVLAAHPAALDARHNRGVALAALGRHDEALAEYARVLQRAPGHVEACYNSGVSLAALNRHEEAIEAYTRVLARDPGHVRARWNRGLSQLALGRFAPGFADYEARRALGDARASTRAAPGVRWSPGVPIEGRTLLLLAEQGLGDCIQFQRFARLLHARGARVVLEAPAPLAALFATLPYVDRVVTRDEALPACDLHCEVASLPALLGTTLETLPPQEPPIAAPAEWSARWAERVDRLARPRIGVAWSGGTGAPGDPRSIPLAAWSAVLELPARFVALQKEIPERDRAAMERFEVAHFERDLADFRDTAALAAHMDLVLTIDTAVAHLAGAMARPTWVLLPFAADWRWLTAREDSPWYPRMRLFRQARPGEWGDVMERVRRELDAHLGAMR